MSRKPVVMVIGASGNMGVATLKALTSQYSGKFDIIAGVRNPEKADSLKDIKGLTVVKATMGDKSLSGTFKGVDRLFINTPPVLNRVEIMNATALAAKGAGVKHVVFVSEMNADDASSIFGGQFLQIESFIKKLGIQASTVRLPAFMENYLSMPEIKSQSSIYFPLDPNTPFATVAVSDGGKAVAAILAEPAKHAGKTYNIISNSHTMNELSHELTAQLGKHVSYVRVSYDNLNQSLLEGGLEQWYADGVLELYRLVEEGSDVTNPSDMSHYHHLTGMVPTSLHDWVAGVKSAFE